MLIELPYPNKDLNPNRKNGSHWAVTKTAKDSALNTAFILTKQAAVGVKFINAPITMTITFIQSDKRHRDLDNLLSSSKSMIDGVASAIGVDDKYFEPVTLKRGYNKSQSATIMELKQNV